MWNEHCNKDTRTDRLNWHTRWLLAEKKNSNERSTQERCLSAAMVDNHYSDSVEGAAYVQKLQILGHLNHLEGSM